jgi:hypothetical protein
MELNLGFNNDQRCCKAMRYSHCTETRYFLYILLNTDYIENILNKI